MERPLQVEVSRMTIHQEKLPSITGFWVKPKTWMFP